MSLVDGMNLEAGATGKDIPQVQNAELTKRIVLAPIGFIAAEAGAQLGVFVENMLADFLMEKDKKGKRDKSWRTKVLIGKVLLAVMLYPVSVPLALGLCASGGLLHWLFGFPTFGECEDQARKRGKQLILLGERPKGRYTSKPKEQDKDEDKDEKEDAEDSEKDSDPKAQADVDLAGKLTDPDVLDIYGKAADRAWERLIQQGHLPVGIKPVINEAMVQQVQQLVREAQQRGTA